jgi:hypothetical protein
MEILCVRFLANLCYIRIMANLFEESASTPDAATRKSRFRFFTFSLWGILSPPDQVFLYLNRTTPVTYGSR